MKRIVHLIRHVLLLSLSPFLLLSFSPFHLFSQEFSYKQYTVQDGLVQSQIWSMFQDSKGYIWAGTKGGVSRFDGIEFLNFSRNDGLPGNFILMITEDSKGVIWFLTREGVAKFDGEMVTGFPTAHFRNSYGVVIFEETDPGVILILHFNSNNELVFTEFSQGQYTNIPSPFPASITFDPKPQAFFALYDPVNQCFLYASKSSGLLRIKGQDIDTLYKNIERFQDLETGRDGIIYLVENDTVFILVNDIVSGIINVKPAFGNVSPGNLKIDKNGRIYYINHNNQLVIGEEDKLITENFDFPLINTILIDNENNLWLGTESGLYRMISRAFVNYIPGKCGIKELIWSISEDKVGRIWFASYTDGLQYYDGEQFTTVHSYITNEKRAIFHFYMGSIIDHEGNILFPMSNIGGIKFDGRQFMPIFPEKVTLTTFFIFEDPETLDLFIGTTLGLYTISPDQEIKVMDIKPGNGKSMHVVSIIKDKLNRYWLGGFNGISMLEENRVVHLPTAELPFEGGGNCMITDRVGNIWIGNSDGLYQYDFHSFERVGKKELNTMITSLALIGDTSLLVGSLSGLAILDLEAYYTEKRAGFIILGKEEGFLGLETGQNAIFRDFCGYYWIACNDRVVRFDPEKLPRNLNPPSTFISGVSLLNEQMEWIKTKKAHEGKAYSLGHDEKNLRFEFTGISTTAPEKVKFTRFLEGYDKGWSNPEQDRYAVYTNLPPGNYSLLLKAANGDGIWSETPAAFSFRIIPAFYQRKIFWAGCIIIAAAIFLFAGVVISNRRKKQQQLRWENEKRMAQLQLLTLKNLIDPHFTYNAINSIASVVLKEDKDKAYRFFVKFSNLIRGIMRSSDQLSRSFEEEISLVKDYLEIEKFRYKEKFEYLIDTSPDVDMKGLIPKMTIQTFAENALKHGLLHMERNGMLLIKLSKEQGFTRIVVEDNGIGRERAAQLATNSTGKGLRILKGYFDYFNTYNKDKIDFYILDLFNEEGGAAGTRITVDIPDGYNFLV